MNRHSRNNVVSEIRKPKNFNNEKNETFISNMDVSSRNGGNFVTT